MAKSQWFNAQRNPPWQSGPYEVRNAIPTHPNALHGLTASRKRYWDASARIWRVSPNGPQSIMGTHPSHQWRGRASKDATDEPEPGVLHWGQ
jgi:hypothetical protein